MSNNTVVHLTHEHRAILSLFDLMGNKELQSMYVERLLRSARKLYEKHIALEDKLIYSNKDEVIKDNPLLKEKLMMNEDYLKTLADSTMNFLVDATEKHVTIRKDDIEKVYQNIKKRAEIEEKEIFSNLSHQN